MTAKTKGSLKLPHAAARANVNNATSCTSAVDLALSHTDDPGGDIDDPGGGPTNAGMAMTYQWHSRQTTA